MRTQNLQASLVRYLVRGAAVVIAALVILLAIGMAVIYPIHRDYYRKVNPREALAYGREVASAVGATYVRTGQFPASLNDLSGLPDRPLFVSEVALSAGGTVRILVADAPKDEGILELVPEIAPQGLRYSCRSVNVPAEFIPPSCER